MDKSKGSTPNRSMVHRLLRILKFGPRREGLGVRAQVYKGGWLEFHHVIRKLRITPFAFSTLLEWAQNNNVDAPIELQEANKKFYIRATKGLRFLPDYGKQWPPAPEDVVQAEKPKAKRPSIGFKKQKKTKLEATKFDETDVKFYDPELEKEYTTAIKDKCVKYIRGAAVNTQDVNFRHHKKKNEYRVKTTKKGIIDAARMELIHNQTDAGFLETDDRTTVSVAQREISAGIDMQTKQKIFDLELNLGPYKAKYFRGGREAILGGRKGHIAVLDWDKSDIHCELFLQETVKDFTFLHNETMFAVAQKEDCYVYDYHGTEIRRLKHFKHATNLSYLPYHFLLFGVSKYGFALYQDSTTGDLVCSRKMFSARPSYPIALNHTNGVIHVADYGQVKLIAPKVEKPLAQILAHKGAISTIDVDRTGRIMVTAGPSSVKLWDLRTFKELETYNTGRGLTDVKFSQLGLLALARDNIVEVWKDYISSTDSEKSKPKPEPYMRHKTYSPITSINFCPYEDVLGVGTYDGFSSLVIPGSGEPNIDSNVENPFTTKHQRREGVVKRALEKIQPDMIALDMKYIGAVSSLSKDKWQETKDGEIRSERPYVAPGKSKSDTQIMEDKQNKRRDQIITNVKRRQEQKAMERAQLATEGIKKSELVENYGARDTLSRFERKRKLATVADHKANKRAKQEKKKEEEDED